ncbi:MAG: hypothetical protein QOH39_1078 [Verrucomicrobiota bacterium]|jgi:hypothetical protein
MSNPEPMKLKRRSNRQERVIARRRKAVLWSSAILLCIFAVVGARPLFHWFKTTRSAQIAVTADDLARAGKWNQAAEKYRAALQLDPVGYAALKGAANLASRLSRPEAIDLWEQVVKTPRATFSDRQEYADQLLIAGRPRVAVRVIEELLKSNPDAKTLGLAARYARSVGDRSKALEFARLAMKNAPDEPIARFRLAELLAESTDSKERGEARGILWDLAGREGLRQPAVEALARAPDLTDDERNRLIEILNTVAPGKIRDALLAADLRLQLHPGEEKEIYDQSVARWNNGDVSDLIDLARWLNLHQQPARVFSLFSIERALQNNQLLLAQLDALASMQRWNEIDNLLGHPGLTLDPSVLESFRARSAQEQNAPLNAEVHWNHAISLAAGDPFKLRFVANFAEQSHAAGVALRVYDQLAKFPEHAAFAYYGTERLSGGHADLLVQKAAAEKISLLAPDNPNAAAQLAYLNLLAGTNVEANTAVAKKLVEKYPDRLSFRVTAALGYLRQHDPGPALAQFKGPSGAPAIEWGNTPGAWRAVYAATLRANEQSAAAEEIIKTIPIDKLSSEERALVEGR